jgi:L-fucose mutarotase
MGALERFAFYEVASKGAAVVRTSEFCPYGCFIFKLGVISDN